jgi:uncharacterized protein YjbI with pentapeptide repeats
MNRGAWVIAVLLAAGVAIGIGLLAVRLRPYWVAKYRGEGADLKGAALAGAPLRGANLQYANLHRANLTGADLRGADLKGVTLTDARLQGKAGKGLRDPKSTKDQKTVDASDLAQAKKKNAKKE